MADIDPTELAQIIQDMVGNATTEVSDRTFKRGVVTAVDSNGYADVEVEGSATATQHLSSMASYSPTVGDKVLLLSIGTSGMNLLLLGKLANQRGGVAVTNGWTQYYTREGKKQWRLRSSFTVNSIAPNAWVSSALSTFPPGVSLLTANYWVDGRAGSAADTIGIIGIYAPVNTNQIIFRLRNLSGNTVNTVIEYDLVITEK